MKVVFLYTEIADYFLKCCEKLAESCEVHIIRWPVNKEAPFKFRYSDKIKVYEKNNYSLEQMKQLVAGLQPSIIVCSGWVDKDYLKVVRTYFKKIPTVMTCDTHWKGSVKQYVAIILSRIFLLNTFSHAWVPGKAQKLYAKKLGFKERNIRLGFYSCDLPRFSNFYSTKGLEKLKNLPLRFLYVGRYYEFKGITDLWNAFIELQTETPNAWELWCLGAGDLSPVQHPKIKHFGFVQPDDLLPFLEQTSVFVLPSRYEPWGVVVQEYAASGFPLLLSNQVGAAEMFLEEGENGFSFKASDKQAIKQALKKIINLSSKELILMSERSFELAQLNSPYKWTNTVLEIYHESQKK